MSRLVIESRQRYQIGRASLAVIALAAAVAASASVMADVPGSPRPSWTPEREKEDAARPKWGPTRNSEYVSVLSAKRRRSKLSWEADPKHKLPPVMTRKAYLASQAARTHHDPNVVPPQRIHQNANNPKLASQAQSTIQRTTLLQAANQSTSGEAAEATRQAIQLAVPEEIEVPPFVAAEDKKSNRQPASPKAKSGKESTESQSYLERLFNNSHRNPVPEYVGTPLSQLTISVTAPPTPNAKGKLASDLPAGTNLPDAESVLPSRSSWATKGFGWAAPNFSHRPLYFAEENLERHGHYYQRPIVQSALSTAHFFGNIALLPYKMGATPPRCRVYSLRHPLPGNCVPFHTYDPMISRRGIFNTAAVATGLVFLVP